LTKYTAITKLRGVGFALTVRNIKILFSEGAAPEKFKILPHTLFGPRFTHACQLSYNPSRDPWSLENSDKKLLKLILVTKRHCLSLDMEKASFFLLFQQAHFLSCFIMYYCCQYLGYNYRDIDRSFSFPQNLRNTVYSLFPRYGLSLFSQLSHLKFWNNLTVLYADVLLVLGHFQGNY
jgi:hypothetical protein